ncbi:MAG: hypothetical protein RI967_360, partial [Planctomycetota bacterium]
GKVVGSAADAPRARAVVLPRVDRRLRMLPRRTSARGNRRSHRATDSPPIEGKGKGKEKDEGEGRDKDKDKVEARAAARAAVPGTAVRKPARQEPARQEPATASSRA